MIFSFSRGEALPKAGRVKSLYFITWCGTNRDWKTIPIENFLRRVYPDKRTMKFHHKKRGALRLYSQFGLKGGVKRQKNQMHNCKNSLWGKPRFRPEFQELEAQVCTWGCCIWRSHFSSYSNDVESLFEGTFRLMGVENGKTYERHVFCDPHKIRRIYFSSLSNAVVMEVGGLLSRIEIRHELAAYTKLDWIH